MTSYVQKLNLSFDPFESNAAGRGFFEGGGRRELCAQIIEQAMYSESVICVSGCLGSGKSSLLAAISQGFGDEAVVIDVVATLFMNPDQFMDQIAGALGLSGDFAGRQDMVHAVCQFAGQLQMDSRSLLIQVDDAHELASDVVKDLMTLKKGSPQGSVQIILFGESQLGNMLESTLEQEQLANLAEFELDGLGSEATLDYVRFKLGTAGFTKPLPLTGSALGEIHNTSNGMPGAINTLVRDALENQYGDNASEAGAILDELESEFSADVAAADSDYTAEEFAEFSADPDLELEDPTVEEAGSNSRHYFAVAGVLLVVLIAAIVLFRPTEETGTTVTQISVPVSSAQPDIEEEASVTAIAERPRASRVLEQQTPASELKADAGLSLDLTNSTDDLNIPVPAPETAVISEISVTEASEPPAIASESAEPVESIAQASPAESESPEPDEVAPIPPAQKERLSSFENSLLTYPSSNFTVQVVGASSETNIQAFIKNNSFDTQAGYFETRLNGKPWYVVVAGNFPDRESALAMLETLSESVRSAGPWVRSLASIQSDIQKLQSEQ